MLSKELAIQLKEAGYPQTGFQALNTTTGEITDYRDNLRDRNHDPVDPVCVPTTDELIDFLGNNFTRLSRIVEFGVIAYTAYSDMRLNTLGIPAYIVKADSTPENALAKLVLEIGLK